MSQNVSSQVLFHFTKSLNAIKSILKEGFFPHFCPEYTLEQVDKELADAGLPPKYSIPMVSFCDLPLSLVSNHLNNYGNFGIGLKKSWGLHNGLAPVIYTHSKAKTRPPMSRLFHSSLAENKDKSSKDMEFLAAYSKPYEGPAWRDGKVQKNVRFYDEREWRFVPPVPHSSGLFISDPKGTGLTEVVQDVYKDFYSLKVTPDDIQYLIVEYDMGETNVIKLHDFIMQSFGQRFTRKDAILVSTAIMTHDCIRDDI